MPPKKTESASKAKSTHATYQDMITDAIISLKDRNGSSRQSLKKYVKANNNLSVTDAMFDSLFNKALRAGVEKGVFEQPKGASGGTKLAKKAAKPAPKKEVADKVKKPAAPKKEAAPKKAAAPKKEAAPKKAAAAAPKKEAAPKKAAAAPKKDTKKAAPKKAAEKPKAKPAVAKTGRVAKPAAKKAAAPKKSAPAKKATKKAAAVETA